MANHSHYTPEIGEEIYQKLLEGYSFRDIGKMKGFPSAQTIHNWQINFPEFYGKCARAKEAQGDILHDEIASLEQRTLDGDLDPDVFGKVVSSKQWRASKLAPKRYGERKVIAGDPEAPLAIQRTHVLDVSHITDMAELAALERALDSTIARLEAPKTIEGETED